MEQGIDDGTLLARIAALDESAMRVLFVRHHGRVLGFVRRMLRSEAMAEEIANEVFLEVWRAAGSFQHRSSPLTWVLSIARKRALNVLRKRFETNWNEDGAIEIADDGDDPEVTAQKADKGEILRRCFEALPPIYREIIDLVYYHELSIKEVCEVLGVPDGTVKTRLFNARKRLEAMLEQAGVDRGWP
ncbi:MAG: sigma-70 family RNA polymerase sigma factor [Rhodomicrobium sp.]|nr:sigma-70 family RNA polymerase sigma factor [Rhodomicrobium sp.]